MRNDKPAAAMVCMERLKQLDELQQLEEDPIRCLRS